MKLKTVLLAATLLAAPTFALADEGTETSVYFGVSSDYVWRGITQSDGAASAFAGVDLTSGPFYVGFYAASVDFNSDASLETDVMVAYKPKVGPVDLEFGLYGYLYPQEDNLNVWEGKLGASYTTKVGLGLGAAVYYSPEVGEGGPDSLYYEGSVSIPLSAKIGPFGLGLGAAAGYYDYGNNQSYVDYSNYKVSLTASAENGWGVELGLTDTDIDDSRTYVTLKKAF